MVGLLFYSQYFIKFPCVWLVVICVMFLSEATSLDVRLGRNLAFLLQTRNETGTTLEVRLLNKKKHHL